MAYQWFVRQVQDEQLVFYYETITSYSEVIETLKVYRVITKHDTPIFKPVFNQ